MSVAKRKILYVWAGSPERRQEIERKVAKDRWLLLPVFQDGEALSKTLQSKRQAGIIFDGLNERVLENLERVERECPEYARFVTCSEAEEASLYSLNGAPPVILRTDEEGLVWQEKIGRAIMVHEWTTAPEMQAVLPRIHRIPALPANYHKLLRLLQDADYDIEQVTSLIGQDMALTTHLLRTVNSAAYAPVQRIQTVPDAVTFLGASEVQAMVVSAWALELISEKSCRGFDPQFEWDHATAVASATGDLAKELKVSSAVSEPAFTGGLLHDLGKLLLAANTPDAYAMILEEAREGNRVVSDVERENLGFSHAEIGACMLALWGLSLPIVEAVAWHHQPRRGSDHEISAFHLVYLADCRVRGKTPEPFEFMR